MQVSSRGIVGMLALRLRSGGRSHPPLLADPARGVYRGAAPPPGVAAAGDCVRAGARFIATNRDPVYPTEHWLRPGAGSVIAAIEVASGTTALVIGKPQPLLMEQAAHAVNRAPTDAIVIGDGIDTDLAAGRAGGARGVLMLTRVTSPTTADAPPRAPPPVADGAAAASPSGAAMPGRTPFWPASVARPRVPSSPRRSSAERASATSPARTASQPMIGST